MTEAITANVFITKSLTAIDKLFFADHRLEKYKESLGKLSEEEFNQSFIASPMNNDGLMYFEYNFQVNGNADQGKGVAVTMRLAETSKLLEMFLLENDPLSRILSERQQKLEDQSKAPKDSNIVRNPFEEVNFAQKLRRSSRYYLAFGTSDNVQDWSGPYSMQLAGATLSNDSNNVRVIEVTFVPQLESFKSYSPKLGTLLGYNDNLQNLSQFVIDDQKQVCSSKSIKKECLNKTFNLDVEIRELLKGYIGTFTNNRNNVVLAFPQSFGDISLEAGPIQTRNLLNASELTGFGRDLLRTSTNPRFDEIDSLDSSVESIADNMRQRGMVSTVKNKGHNFKIRESVFKDFEDFKRTGINVSILERYGGPKSEQAKLDYLTQQGLAANLKQGVAAGQLPSKNQRAIERAVADSLLRETYVEERTIAFNGEKLKVQNDTQKKLELIEAEINEFQNFINITPDTTLTTLFQTQADPSPASQISVAFVRSFRRDGQAILTAGFDPQTLSQGLQTPGITPSQRAAYIIFYELGIRTLMEEANKNNQDLRNAVVNAQAERENKRIDTAYENDLKLGSPAERKWFAENSYRLTSDRESSAPQLQIEKNPINDLENQLAAEVAVQEGSERTISKKIDRLFEQNVAAKWELVSESKRALAKILEDELGFKLSIDQSNGTPQNVYNGFSPLVSPLIKFASEIKDRGDGNIKTSYFDFYEETDMRILKLWAEHGIISNPKQPAYVFGDMHEIAKTLYLEDGEPQDQTVNTLFGYDDLVAGNEGIPYEVKKGYDLPRYRVTGKSTDLISETRVPQVAIAPVNSPLQGSRDAAAESAKIAYQNYKNKFMAAFPSDDTEISLRHNMTNPNVTSLSYRLDNYIVALMNMPARPSIDKGAMGTTRLRLAKDQAGQVLSKPIQEQLAKYAATLDANTDSITFQSNLLDNSEESVSMALAIAQDVNLGSPDFARNNKIIDLFAVLYFYQFFDTITNTQGTSELRMERNPNREDTFNQYYQSYLDQTMKLLINCTARTLPIFDKKLYLDRVCHLNGMTGGIIGTSEKFKRKAPYNGAYRIRGYRHVISPQDIYSEFDLYREGFTEKTDESGATVKDFLCKTLNAALKKDDLGRDFADKRFNQFPVPSDEVLIRARELRARSDGALRVLGMDENVVAARQLADEMRKRIKKALKTMGCEDA